MKIIYSLAILLMTCSIALGQTGVASVYGGSDGLCGHKTASGERFNCGDLTAAHRTYPMGTRLRVTYHGKSVVVRINDRGPYHGIRIIDLSPAAASRIGLHGTGTVTIEVIR